ncbi:interaptin-like [Cylas formicarius]|uniref:interaptin-like n=1 Tax=Cylas formicarius TaxID=197179 RepID=UPI002958991F|nr:interaptin-like [Cylas formicarius]
MSDGDLKEYHSIVDRRAKFYKEECAKMEEIFKKLKLRDLEYLTAYLDDGDSGEFVLELDRARVCQMYMAHLKKSIQYFINLNNRISSDLRYFEEQSQQSRQDFDHVLKTFSRDINQLKEKESTYQRELTKFEKKYPWLSDPEYNLTSINQHVDRLKALREEKESLLKEVAKYQNLKPDLKEARQQVNDLKKQLSELTL